MGLLSGSMLLAQTPYEPDALKAEDYEKAEQGLSQYTRNLVYDGSVRAKWIDENRFWYRNNAADGEFFILVDISKKSRKRAFDHGKLAAALSKETGGKYTASNLPFSGIAFSDDLKTVSFNMGRSRYVYDPAKGTLDTQKPEPRAPRNSILSPDGKKAAFIKDYNLYIEELASGEVTQLTTDGVEDFGYATNNAGWIQRESPVLLWSPDSKKIATFQHDGRGVGEMYLATTNVGHPELKAWKYPLPGDSLIFRIERVVIHLDDQRVVRLQMPADPHRSSTTDHIAGWGGKFLDVAWSEDSEELAFLSNSRDHQEATMRVADPATGKVRTVYSEKVPTFYESGNGDGNWRFLPEFDAFIWYSQKSDWGHLYLHDLKSGELTKTITQGDWNVLDIRHIDRDNKVIYFTGAGREPGDPYFQYFYRVNLDGSDLQLLTPDSANHVVSLSPGGDYLVDVYSTPTEPPVSVVRNMRGEIVLELERADITKLVASGWQPPMPFSVKARDGETDLYGLLFKPADFDPNKKYPIINYIYPGPQSGSVGSRSFSPSRRDNQAIANLGFIVVSLDAMGTPMRSKSFHTAYYGNMGDNGLPDQIAGMKQLAERYPWIDLDRAGIYGHSGGGFASTDAILRYPDFFKVAVSGAGNHDNRNYEDDWGEKWQGLLVENPDGTTNYDNQANQLLVENLKGKLLLAHGTMDDNVPYYNTLLVADRLIAANKDFDLVMFPNRRHGFGNEPYMMRKRWDYFVEHLLGATPPKEYTFKYLQVRP
ncbi:S9 family peptidase [Flavilitoribacter nigricans DSM 23189 = NBRC 102662]|uniref:S9 family peptidase n=2 Tax=Flavilitoribacter TaxID=2762562 RepID=A0A2D0N1B5_FLAN2|nr:S9 family peptidase [Flavilitoribacter nigricans DSM 23189 = NBRC 102662]